MFAERRDGARVRQAVIEAHPELQERELIKLAGLASRIADGLADRGVPAAAASLAAQTALAIFRLAFERWVAAEDRGLDEFIREALGELRAVVGG
jgi:hypothetical protein